MSSTDQELQETDEMSRLRAAAVKTDGRRTLSTLSRWLRTEMTEALSWPQLRKDKMEMGSKRPPKQKLPTMSVQIYRPTKRLALGILQSCIVLKNS